MDKSIEARLNVASRDAWAVGLPQAFPPAVEAELQTRCFLSSIFMDWLSAHDSLDTDETPTTVLLAGLVPLDRGMRVELLLGCRSAHG